MGRMKEVFMELYYNFDGCIPQGYDYNAFMADYLNKLENEHTEKTQKESLSGKDLTVKTSKTSEEI